MSNAQAAAAAVRHLMPQLTRDALQLAAELLTTLQSAKDILAPIAETHEAAGLAFQLIADACASAEPPPATAPRSCTCGGYPFCTCRG
ncbi:hypothetical protein [Methylobacterium sp. J-092]|uniref:hypothetical protein n=1 Tax=Methylobacterium sp. J-092 TaxID=2836667 RepID=UPI001FB9AD9C|nr:hypothetical protein [Methylobacterium sp. J-092]MCJ2009192.1 hypothetical protein [Methylobacterium sp. J-092]